MDERPTVSPLTQGNSTVPSDLEIRVVGLEEGLARALRNTIGEFVEFFGTQFDLSGLDGITVAS